MGSRSHRRVMCPVVSTRVAFGDSSPRSHWGPLQWPLLPVPDSSLSFACGTGSAPRLPRACAQGESGQGLLPKGLCSFQALLQPQNF